MGEWLKPPVLKTGNRKVRGFESHSLRQLVIAGHAPYVREGSCRMRPFLILAGLLCAGCGPEPVRQPAAPPPRPNILLVTVDTVRADHTSVHGYERDTTPFLVELAAEGVRFDRAYATASSTFDDMIETSEL